MNSHKEVIIKVYNQSGDTLEKIVTNFKNLPTWKSLINGGYGDTSVILDGKFDEIPDYLSYGNIVEIYKVDNFNKSGKLVYKGYISEIAPELNSRSYEIQIPIRHISDKLKNTYYKNGSLYEVSISSTEISEVFEDIIDNYQTQTGDSFISYTASSLEDTGSILTYVIGNIKHFDAIKKIFEFTPQDWIWFIDFDGQLNLKELSSNADHVLTIGKNVEVVKPIGTTDKLINKCNLQYDGGDITVEDSSSISNYGIFESVIVDDTITSLAVATLKATKLVYDNSNPKITGTLIVNELYDTTTLKVGDTIKLNNYKKDSSILNNNMMIASIDFKWNKVQIELGEVRSDFSRILDLFISQLK